MIALVLAAGRGTRLGSTVPKPLVPIAGIPMIDRILDGLAEDGFSDVVVVTGHEADRIERHLAGRDVAFARQLEPAGTADALLAARTAIGDEPFVLTWVDVLVPAGTYAAVAADRHDHDGAIAVDRVDDASSGGLVTMEGDLVTRITEKPGPVAGWNLTGVLALDAVVWPHAAAVERSPRGELELPDALNAWIDGGARICGTPVEGPVFEVGTHAGRDAANAAYANDER